MKPFLILTFLTLLILFLAGCTTGDEFPKGYIIKYGTFTDPFTNIEARAFCIAHPATLDYQPRMEIIESVDGVGEAFAIDYKEVCYYLEENKDKDIFERDMLIAIREADKIKTSKDRPKISAGGLQ